MKNKNIETIFAFSIDSKEYAPVKAAISEELKAVISRVYQLDHETGRTLHYLTNIMMDHFHEDVARVTWGELSPIESNLNGLASRIESTRLELLKAGYEDKIGVGNPMWYLKLALSEIKSIHKLSKKAQGKKNER